MQNFTLKLTFAYIYSLKYTVNENITCHFFNIAFALK